MTGRVSSRPVSYSAILSYFLPLAFQAAAQSLTYPLVAMVASRGQGGILNLAGVAQANTVMFLIGTLGAGLVTAGMIYGKTRAGYDVFLRVNTLLAVTAGVLQLLVCIGPVSHGIFGHLIGLPEGIEQPARIALLTAVPLQILFFLRNPFQAVLYSHGATGLAGGATVLRILMTVVLAYGFSNRGLVGPFWAVVCMTLPVAGEVVLSWFLSRTHLRALAAGRKEAPSVTELLSFAMPLSAGGLLLSLSGMLIGGVIAHAADPQRMLPAYYLAVGLSAPLAFAASRVQPVLVAFAPDRRGLRTIFSFTILVGSLFGFLPLLFILPGLAEWYYVGLQKCGPEMLGLVRLSAIGLVFQPIVVALRAFAEGMAAVRKNSVAILAGQGVFLAVLAVVSIICLALAVPGNLIAPIGLISANLAAAVLVYYALVWKRTSRIPVGLKSDAPEGNE